MSAEKLRHLGQCSNDVVQLQYDLVKTNYQKLLTEPAKSVSSAIGGKRTPPNQSPPKEHCSITPAKAAALKTTYINQIKDLHDLFESGAISEADYLKQQDIVLMQMANL